MAGHEQRHRVGEDFQCCGLHDLVSPCVGLDDRVTSKFLLGTTRDLVDRFLPGSLALHN